MRYSLTAVWMMALAMAAFGIESNSPAPLVVQVPVSEQAPKVDGNLDDACWKAAYTSPSFYDFALGKTNYGPNPDTTVRMLTDGKWLYMAFECKHPDPLRMKADVKENLGGRVFGDECIKIFLNPGLPDDNQYYRYVLNCNNVYEINRAFSVQGATPMLAWPSATCITKDGWTAEVAIPLFDLAGYGDLKDVRLNIFRKKIIKQYDTLAVEVGFNEFISTMSPTATWSKRDDMVRLEGLDKVKLEFPFVVNAGAVSVGELYDADGEMRYDVTMTLKAMTDREGSVEVVVVEKPATGDQRRVSKTFAMKPHQVTPATVTVPVQTLGQRNIDVVIRDPATAMPFQTVQVRNAASFELLRALARLNYYTGEESAEVLYTIGMSQKALAEKCLVVSDAAGKEHARSVSPNPEGLLAFPLRDIPAGRHTLNLALKEKDGRKMFAVDFELTRLAPKPGSEWKVDRATGGTLLHDGQPFFPFGFLVARNDDQYKEIAQAGFNTVMWWFGNYPPNETPEDFSAVAQLAQTHGLKLILNLGMGPSRADQMPTLKKYFSGKDYEKAVDLNHSMCAWKYLAIPGTAPWNKITRQQRNEIAADWMDAHLPAILDNVRAMLDMPNVIGYFTCDEPPEFVEADIDVELRRMTAAVNKLDPYRLMFALYSSKIPEGARYTSFSDALGTDPYWTPGRPTSRGSVNWMSSVTARTVARAKAAGLMPWTVAMSALWSNTQKRMITPQEQICQTYLALIHGTRGIIYFTHHWVVTEGQWDAMKTLAARIRELTPAITAMDPKQEIAYTPGAWAPLKDEVPDVQTRLMRFPDGRYVLLAANVRLSPVEVSIHVDGLRDSPLNDLFDGKLGVVKDGVFTDTIGARGVRSYVFDRIDTQGPARIAVNIKPLGKEGVIESGYQDEGRVGMKNIMPNPSFEEASVPGWPDHYIPSFGYGGMRRRIGSPEAPVGLSAEKPWHGKQCLFIARSEGNIYWKIAPQLPDAQPYVLSFYARTESPKPVMLAFQSGLLAGRSRESVKIEGAEWKRYFVRMNIPPRISANGGTVIILPPVFEAPGRIFLDAFQMEPGLEPTEFQP